MMTQPPNVMACSGSSVAVNFSGGVSGTTYNWTDDNSAIGLAASGSGNLNFTATMSDVVQVANISVKPKVGACNGLPYNFTITINPHLIMDKPPDLTVCAGQNVQTMFTGPANPTFSWTNSNPSIGLGASGNGNLNFTAANVLFAQTGLVTVTPTGGMCGSTPESFQITVIPKPVMNAVADVVGCSGQLINVEFLGNFGTDFEWTNDNPSIGLPSSGTGSLHFTGEVGIAHLTVKPTNGPCVGAPKTFIIRIYPSINVKADDKKINCDTLPNILTLTTNSNPANYYWAGPGGFTSILKNPTIDTIGNYIVIVTNPTSGCTATDTARVENCCLTKAGSFDTAQLILCNKKPFKGYYKNNAILEGNDTLKFILFKDTLDVLGSILAYSDSAYFKFNADTMFLDTTYFIAAVAADTTKKKDSINLKDPCLSISKRLAVIWKSNPTIKQLPFSTAICKDDCINLVFEFTGTPPFSYQLTIEQNGLILYDKPLISIDFIQPLTLCPSDFFMPILGGELHVSVGGLADFYCGCGK